jgi:multiple sugar transport system substrate-binding protein
MATTRRGFMLAGTGGVTASLLGAACGPVGSNPAPPAAERMPAEMTWLGWSMGAQWQVPTYEQVASGFTDKFPNTKLTPVAAGGNFREKLTTLVTAGTPPDITDVHHQKHVRDVGTAGVVIALDDLLKRDPYPRDYLGWEPYAWQKKQYGVPWAIQSTAIFYNRTIFDEAGVTYPNESWTWENFLEAARRLTKPGPDDASTVWGAADQGGRNNGWIDALLHAFGGSILSKDHTRTVMSDANSLRALEFRASWGPRFRVAPSVPGGTSGQFQQGTVAMATSGSWYVVTVRTASNSQIANANVPWDVAPVPRGPARHAALSHELGVGISSGVPNVDASWAALKYVTSPEALIPFARIGRIIAPQKSLWGESIPTDGTPAGFKRAFLDVWEKNTLPSPFVPRWASDLDPIWMEELDAVWTGERPARDGATAFDRRAGEVLRQLKGEGLL